MKQFLRRITFFLLPLVILAWPIDLIVSSCLKHTPDFSGELEVWKDIYNPDKNHELVVYGSSRAWVQIDPEILTDSLGMSAYNYGVDGHNFRIQYLRHAELVRNGKKPHTIILSADMFTLQRRSDLYCQEQFLPYMLWNENSRVHTELYEGFRPFDYYVPLVRYFGREKALKAAVKCMTGLGCSIPYRKLGYRAHDQDWNSDLDEARSIMSDYKVVIDEETVKLLNRFLEECRRSDIKVIMVYAPEHIEGQEFVSNRDEVMELFTQIAAQNKLPFLDYSDDEICRSKEYFYNANHLNLKGAELFTRKLAYDIKSLQTSQ